MKKAEGLRSAELVSALERALAGDAASLFRQLELQSGLPGPRVNTSLALAFAYECSRLGERAETLTREMALLPADEARGASGKEFLSVCGVLAFARCAASSNDPKARLRALALLEEKADDLRFRVRDAVPLALASLGHEMQSELVEHVLPWMDRYFHATAVIRALAEPDWLETFGPHEPEAPIDLLDRAFDLAHDAPRSAARYPGHKALVEALGSAPKAVARRFGTKMFDGYVAWAKRVTVPELREAILANLADPQMKKAFGGDIERVKAGLEQSKKPPRDPSILRHGTRGRGKKRDRR